MADSPNRIDARPLPPLGRVAPLFTAVVTEVHCHRCLAPCAFRVHPAPGVDAGHLRLGVGENDDPKVVKRVMIDAVLTRAQAEGTLPRA